MKTIIIILTLHNYLDVKSIHLSKSKNYNSFAAQELLPSVLTI